MNKLLFGSLWYMLFVVAMRAYGQPYTELAQVNYQHFSVSSGADYNQRVAHQLISAGFFVPAPMKKRNALLFRLQAEAIDSRSEVGWKSGSQVMSLALGVGFQRLSASEQWGSVVTLIPKLAGDFEGSWSNKNLQYGLLFLQRYRANKDLQFKAGIYYNREVYGNFLVPLVGIDYRISDHWQMYGTLPTNYRIAYSWNSKKCSAGINFRALTRSFYVTEGNRDQYVRFDEILLKVYFEYYFRKNWVFYSELGRSLGDPPQLYHRVNREVHLANPNYSGIGEYTVISCGIAWRISTD